MHPPLSGRPPSLDEVIGGCGLLHPLMAVLVVSWMVVGDNDSLVVRKLPFLEDVEATTTCLGLPCSMAMAMTPRYSGQLIRQSNHTSRKSDYSTLLFTSCPAPSCPRLCVHVGYLLVHLGGPTVCVASGLPAPTTP